MQATRGIAEFSHTLILFHYLERYTHILKVRRAQCTHAHPAAPTVGPGTPLPDTAQLHSGHSIAEPIAAF